MQKSLVIKLTLIAVLCCLFVVGLGMIKLLVHERQSYERAVINDIKENHIQDQKLVTPFLLVQTAQGIALPIVANESAMNANLDVNDKTYARDIYKAISYQGAFHVKQNFSLQYDKLNALYRAKLQQMQTAAPTPPAVTSSATSTASQAVLQAATPHADDKSATPPQAVQMSNMTPISLQLIVPISDLRGVGARTVKINGKPYPLDFGEYSLDGYAMKHYLQADISELLPTMTSDINADTTIDISGIGSIHVAPTGQNVELAMTTNWPDPKFAGNALPTQKSLTQQGFSANWQSPFLNKSNSSSLAQTINCQECVTDFQYFSTDFISDNNQYTKTDRTIKYALILLVVSFGTFFLFEVIKQLKIHPIQYALVASALLVFYALLLSLAEQIAFWQAYLIASSACIGLIGWYAFYMLKSVSRACIFASILSVLYAAFYFVLTSSRFNLLFGATFCFVLIFITMYITRHINWYEVNRA